MFDLFSWSHILILLAVALVVVGPQELPRLMHIVGRWAGKARGMANEFKRSFDEIARQSELDELRKEVQSLRTNNPLADIHRDIQKSLSEATADINATPADGTSPEAKPQPGTVAYEEMLDRVEPRGGEMQVTETPVPEKVADEAPKP